MCSRCARPAWCREAPSLDFPHYPPHGGHQSSDLEVSVVATTVGGIVTLALISQCVVLVSRSAGASAMLDGFGPEGVTAWLLGERLALAKHGGSPHRLAWEKNIFSDAPQEVSSGLATFEHQMFCFSRA